MSSNKSSNKKFLSCCGEKYKSYFKFCGLCGKLLEPISKNTSSNKLEINSENENDSSIDSNNNSVNNTPKINRSNNQLNINSNNNNNNNTNKEPIVITLNSRSSTLEKPRRIIVIRKDHLKKDYPKNDFNQDDYDFDDEEERIKIKTRIEETNRKYNNYSTNNNNGRENNNNSNYREEDEKDKKWDEFMKIEEAKSKLEKGELVEGVVRVNPYNRSHIYITASGMEKDILVEGLQNQNRVIEGDRVAVLLYPKSEWKEIEEKETVVLDDPIFDEIEKKHLLLEDVNSSSEKSDSPSVEKVEENSNENKEPTPNESSIDQNKQNDVSPTEQKPSEEKEKSYRPTGKIVCILEELHEKEYLGFLQPNTKSLDKLVEGEKFALFVPFNKKIPKCFVLLKGDYTCNRRNEKKLNNNIFQIRLKDWRINNRHPFGELIKDFGEAKDFEVEKKLLLEENSISYDDTFSEQVNKCVPDENWQISEEERKVRRDLTDLRIVSIDPSTAKDLDDAVSIKKLKNGNYQVGVHIADVTHFVKPGNALDDEARIRGCTIYLVERSIPMLPRILSETLCSLNVGSETLAFSVLMEVNPVDTSIVSTWFGKSIIKTCGQLSYEQAQEIIDKEGDLHQLENIKKCPKLDNSRHPFHKMVRDILLLNDLAKKMRDLRFENGSLTLKDMEIRFGIDEKGRPNRWFIKDQTQSMKLIEEYMLLANKVVAMKIYEHFPENSLLRLHPSPKKERFQHLQQVCRRNNIFIDTSSSKNLNSSLEKAKSSLPKLKYEALMYLTLRTMQQAKYVSTYLPNKNEKKEGEENDERKVDVPGSRHSTLHLTKESSGYNKGGGATSGSPFHHYALNIPIYTHFTSPIRRYPDVIVHRLLYAAIHNLPAPENIEELDQICKNSNEKKLQADDASKQSGIVFLCTFIQDKDVWTRAVVWDITDKKIGVLVPQYGVDQMLVINDLGCSSHAFDEKSGTLHLVWSENDEESDQQIDKNNNNNENENDKIDSNNNSEKPDLLNEMKLSVFSEIVVSLHVNQKRMRLSLDIKLERDKRKIATASKQKVIRKKSEFD